MPPTLQDIQFKEQRLDELRGAGEIWELTRKCHAFRSLDMSAWDGVNVLSLRSLCLAVGESLEAVRRRSNSRMNESLWASSEDYTAMTLFPPVVHCVKLEILQVL